MDWLDSIIKCLTAERFAMFMAVLLVWKIDGSIDALRKSIDVYIAKTDKALTQSEEANSELRMKVLKHEVLQELRKLPQKEIVNK